MGTFCSASSRLGASALDLLPPSLDHCDLYVVERCQSQLPPFARIFAFSRTTPLGITACISFTAARPISFLLRFQRSSRSFSADSGWSASTVSV